jgi:DNA-binding transcriptional LysR family regulator
MVIVGTRDYFARKPAPRAPEDLAAHDCIRFRFTTSGRLARWDLQHDGRLFEIEVSGRFIVNDFVAELDLARRGLALAQVVESTAADDIRAERLATTLDSYAPTLGAAHLYFPGTTHMPARLRVFIDYFQAANAARRAAG